MTGYQSKRAMAQDKLETWDTPSEAFNEWWDSDYDDSTNPYEKDTFAYWAWAGWKAALAQPAQEPVTWAGVDFDINTTPPQRPWVGLTEEETLGFTQHEMSVVKYVSKVLQEKNT